ncbi:DEAD/DEAH box helicase family protein [Merdimonas faecis]|uniref:DEAD/DEAH box helicase family protein n=1 Tax=Merdimonas faecis TaxID=1653435 RepID=UPI0008637163|nr:DEAD/DEAH box helicase family protein [Merdimonas faecis]
MEYLRSYQKDAVNKVCKFFRSSVTKAKICLSPGLGKTTIIVSSVQALQQEYGDNLSVAILTSGRIICDQIRTVFLRENCNLDVASNVCEMTTEKLLVTTYQDVMRNQSRLQQFDLIICDEAQFVKRGECFGFLLDSHVKFLGVLQNTESLEGWFGDAACLFVYSIREAINDGYDIYPNERQLVEIFLIPLLKKHGYQDIKKEKKILDDKNLRADIVAQKDNKTVVMEVNSYRSLYNSKFNFDNAIKQILLYKDSLTQKNPDKKYSFIIVLLCGIDEDSKNEIYKRYHIVVWDINNLIYLCEENKKLISLLTGCLPYSSLALNPKRPINVEIEQKEIVSDEKETSLVKKYMEILESCKPGKLGKADKKFEHICTEIVKILFETEFYRVLEQHRTNDEMFQIDLLCSLKGTTAFWKFLMSFYHTKFVVFEYKNYSDYISQNLIYNTEKYLFPVALQNVAFIISRKGFDQNAKKAALGCLRESGKLIISLNDNDLITMLSMKEKGEEPSDYLLDKVEYILMSISK